MSNVYQTICGYALDEIDGWVDWKYPCKSCKHYYCRQENYPCCKCLQTVSAAAGGCLKCAKENKKPDGCMWELVE